MSLCENCPCAKRKRGATFRQRMVELRNKYGAKLCKSDGCSPESMLEESIKYAANGNGWTNISGLANHFCRDTSRNDEIELALEFVDKLTDLYVEYREKLKQIDTVYSVGLGTYIGNFGEDSE